MMIWDSIIVEKASAYTSSTSEIQAFEKEWNILFPKDHKAFLTELGDGTVYNRFDIFGLDFIPAYTKEYRSRWAEYFHWNSPQSALNHKELLRCICIGETVSTDELILSPDYPQKLFMLPESTDQILDMGSSLIEAMKQDITTLKRHILKVAPEEWNDYDIRPIFQAIER